MPGEAKEIFQLHVARFVFFIGGGAVVEVEDVVKRSTLRDQLT